MSTPIKKKHHIVIIGGGPGGYEAALAGIQLGAEVTLIERNGVGGSAVLTDVVPSKALIATADAANAVRHATDLGIRFKSSGASVHPEVDIDLGAINQRLGHISVTAEQLRALGFEPAAIEKGAYLLAQLQLADKRDAWPARLSGGQQQRVAIARALAMDPICMLFDEPTSALDPEMINEVLDVMVELAREGMTMMCVTHEMGFAKKVANRVIFMDQGRIVEDDSKDAFFANPRSERAQHFLAKILSH